MNKFLIIYPGALGDILLTRPILFYLKEQFPGCQIDYVGNPDADSLDLQLRTLQGRS